MRHPYSGRGATATDCSLASFSYCPSSPRRVSHGTASRFAVSFGYQYKQQRRHSEPQPVCPTKLQKLRVCNQRGKNRLSLPQQFRWDVERTFHCLPCFPL